MTAKLPPGPRRFLFIDGLRGIAALAVIVPHAIGLIAHPKAGAAGPLALKLSPYFAQGVQVFFVISGFAIAYSMKDALSPHFRVGRFILRRAVRLDPPYWVALLLYGSVEAVRALASHQPIPVPELQKSIAHVFYLQDLLGLGQFNIVFWTLCLEFQFYLAFAVIVRLIGLLPNETATKSKGDGSTSFVLVGAFVTCFVISHLTWPPAESGGWFVPYFYVFLAGVLTCWRAIGRLSDRLFLPCVALMCLGCGLLRTPDRQFAALTVVGIYAAIRANALNVWLRGPIIQALGRVSYSIYLVHVPVALVVGGLRVRLGADSTLASFAAFAAVYLITVALSFAFYSVVEAPCLKASHRLKRMFLPKEPSPVSE